MLNGTEVTMYTDFHSYYCNNPSKHTEQQLLIDGDNAEPSEDDRVNETEIEMLALLMSYTPEKRANQIAEMWQAYNALIRADGEQSPGAIKLFEIVTMAEDFIQELED